MSDNSLPTIHRQDYTPPAYLVEQVELRFELDEAGTTVASRLQLRRNPAEKGGALVLAGRQLELTALRLDGRPLGADEYAVDAETLTIAEVPAAFLLEVETRIHPESNTSLEGLYTSSGNFCTQCEAQGFRKITYYLDRPDVMARFTTTIVADRGRYPVLLSNGNPVAKGELKGGRHFVTWEDPFPKPCYLFALVAGDLVKIEDRFITASGREVALQIFVEERNRDKCAHAMASLKKSMAWDEEVFGLEYDLDIYMILAVDDFNMGAMENKGLNIFNSKYVLARPDTATDLDYQGIEGVIGHEYFHNWTGNRVTCRDWFQLSLKEGLTVFRDQEFSADMTSRAVKRINDVRVLRGGQFSEDAGPMAHPVRPDSYQEINNFYTATVYNKGAEVIRMLHTLIGPAAFRQGMDLYFERHDGQAVTCDDFVAAMADASGRDLEQFKLWYSQSGTPELSTEGHYDGAAQSYTLRLRQSCPPTPGQPHKLPFHLPVAVGLLDPEGRDLPLQLAGEAAPGASTRVLELREAEQSFVFVGLAHQPVVSLLRGFSAPVRLKSDSSPADLAFRMAHDNDAFNRWEAGQQLATRLLLQLVADLQLGRELQLDPLFASAFGRTLADREADPALLALALLLPAETVLAEEMAVADPVAIRSAREWLRRALAAELRGELLARVGELQDHGPYRPDGPAVGRRSLKNICLAYLVSLGDAEGVALALEQFQRGDNMTDVNAALVCLASHPGPERELALAAFYQRWQNDPLVVNKWLTLQAMSLRPEALEEVRGLLSHPAFTLHNPNKVYALIGAFAQGNPAAFHAADGSGYAFLAEQVLALDALNPQVAARMVAAFNRWQKYDAGRQGLMQGELRRLLAKPDLSRDVREIVTKALA